MHPRAILDTFKPDFPRRANLLVIKRGDTSDLKAQRTVWNTVVDVERHLREYDAGGDAQKEILYLYFSGYVSPTHAFGRRVVLLVTFGTPDSHNYATPVYPRARLSHFSCDSR